MTSFAVFAFSFSFSIFSFSFSIVFYFFVLVSFLAVNLTLTVSYKVGAAYHNIVSTLPKSKEIITAILHNHNMI